VTTNYTGVLRAYSQEAWEGIIKGYRWDLAISNAAYLRATSFLACHSKENLPESVAQLAMAKKALITGPHRYPLIMPSHASWE